MTLYNPYITKNGPSGSKPQNNLKYMINVSNMNQNYMSAGQGSAVSTSSKEYSDYMQVKTSSDNSSIPIRARKF